MNPIFLDFGKIQIYWYSITMMIAILVGTIIFFKEAKKQKYSDEFITDLLFYTIIFGIIGARLYYVLFNFKYYMQNPIEILQIWNGGLAIHGALIGGGLCLLYYSFKNKINPLKIFDIASIPLIIAQAIGRWGNFFNSEAHGVITTRLALEKQFIPNFIIKGMYINGNYYLPTFYYEFLWNLLGFFVLIIVKRKTKYKIGKLTGLYFMWYSFARFFIEGLRTDSLMIGNFRIAQIISILLFTIGIILICYHCNTKSTICLKERK